MKVILATLGVLISAHSFSATCLGGYQQMPAVTEMMKGVSKTCLESAREGKGREDFLEHLWGSSCISADSYSVSKMFLFDFFKDYDDAYGTDFSSRVYLKENSKLMNTLATGSMVDLASYMARTCND